MRSSAPTDLASLDASIVACRRCPRLIDWCQHVAEVKRAAYADEEYWGKPVPGFGHGSPALWIVGLAPGAHGANRTGRMFTGDRSGDWLFAALHRAGFASTSTSTARDDGQELIDTRITAAVHCAPPDNKPSTSERRTCATWLETELRIMEPSLRVGLALGSLAWTAMLSAMRSAGWSVMAPSFGHACEGQATSPSGHSIAVVGSYHPSQQNTFTGRLTVDMLDAVMHRCRSHIPAGERP